MSPSPKLLVCGRRADLEHEDELVLGAVERAHAAVGLVPDAEVLELREHRLAGGKQLAHVAPVHADEGDGAVAHDRGGVAKRLGAGSAVNAASVISPTAIANSRWRMRPSPQTWPSICTL